jgi:tetratricopeptide (TPR) repeat protein
MTPTVPRRLLSLFLITSVLGSQLWATCGGGGGGGMGGMSSGGGSSPQVYYVPWKVLKTDDSPKQGLIVYWFPATVEEARRSSLLESRTLSLYAQQCISMVIADGLTAFGQKFVASATLPVAVITESDGTVVSRLDNTNGKLKVGDLEKLVDAEVKKRESAIKEHLESAKSKAKSGDNQGAITEYRSVYDQKCMFPGRAKDAAKELKKLGAEVAEVPDAPNTDPATTAKIEKTMRAGLKAENGAKYIEAERFYQTAHQIDPADPAPLRYLGELYRHHIGDWQKARQTFNTILNMPADPMSRAVALHGLGKMTIHEGEFKKGLALMEQSVGEFPLALAYRNLAVYWNSEGDLDKAEAYTKDALKLDPTDPYNLVFAAVFTAVSGHTDEAIRIAQQNEKLLPASYNLAAIYAQAGHKQKALDLLKRHFFQYERYDAVRSKEMMEARVDAVFASLMDDRQFMALTSGADDRLPVSMRSTSAGQR